MAKKSKKAKYPSSFCEYVDGVSVGLQKTHKAGSKYADAWVGLGDSIFAPRKPAGKRRSAAKRSTPGKRRASPRRSVLPSKKTSRSLSDLNVRITKIGDKIQKPRHGILRRRLSSRASGKLMREFRALTAERDDRELAKMEKRARKLGKRRRAF